MKQYNPFAKIHLKNDLTARRELRFLFIDDDLGSFRVSLFHGQGVVVGIGFVIIDSSFHILLVNLFGREKSAADIFRHFEAEAFAAIHVDRNIIFGR